MINKEQQGRLVKSPSDTTLYAPALRRAPHLLGNNQQAENLFLDHSNHQNQFLPQGNLDGESLIPVQISSQVGPGSVPIPDSNNIDDQITNFVQGIWLDTRHIIQKEGNPDEDIQIPSTSNAKSQGVNKLQEARDHAQKIILEAERYRANVEQPTGLPFSVTNQNNSISDDEFFHLTCHVDLALRDKIQKGDFVELEKLLPKDKLDRNDGRMELVNRDGQSYFVPYNRDAKITNVRRWEQAFRIYAAIYSAANPSRSAEIWQYVYVINSAATTYVWEDVAHYNFVFRQLMAVNPGRSWAKTYTQMWQMIMRTHLPQRGNHNARGNFHTPGGLHDSGGKRTRNCWKFNKGRCSDANCRFPHKCNYCDGKHGIYTCFKREKRNSDKSMGAKGDQNIIGGDHK